MGKETELNVGQGEGGNTQCVKPVSVINLLISSKTEGIPEGFHAVFCYKLVSALLKISVF